MGAHRKRSRLGFGLELAFPLVLNILLAAPPAWGVTVSGTVASTDGGPFTRGNVWVETASGGGVSDPFPIPEGVTQFSFSLRISDRPLHPREAPTEDYQVVVSGGGHYIAPFPFTLTCPNDLPPDYWGFPTYGECEPTSVSVVLIGPSDAGNIEGTVKDRGQPIANATVTARQVTPEPWQGGYHLVYSTTTDETGYYSFRWTGPPDVFGVSVRESGSEDYDVTVTATFSEGVLEATKRVTVRPATFSRVNFELQAPMDRAKETAQGPQDCLNLVGSPINVTTGNMYTQQEDLAYPSAFGRFAFTRTYNSQSTYIGPLGHGWTHPFDFELKELQPGVIRIRNGAGNVRFYELVPGSTDTFQPAAPARDTSTLVKYTEGFTETERDGLSRKFDTSGRLTQIVTRSGWTTTLSYSGTQLASVTDPGGRTLSFSYSDSDSDRKLIRVDGPGGLFSTYSYDAQGQLLVSVADALGTQWTYTYSDTSTARLTSVRDANGNLVEGHTYDEEGRVTFTQGAGGSGARTLEYVDGSTTRVTHWVTEGFSRVTTYTFGNFGDQPLVTHIEGPCSCGEPDRTIEYDLQGRRTGQIDARGNTTAFEYDADGNLVKVTDGLGQVTTLTYNPFGQVLTTTDPTGATTAFTYDETTGFLWQVTNALGLSATLSPDVKTLPGAVTDARGHTTTFLFEANGLLETLTDPTGATTTFSYGTAGRLLGTTNALGESTHFSYDVRGRLLSVTDPIGTVTQFQYDAAGNRIRVKDPNGRVTSYTYDAANRLIAVTDPAKGSTTYSYDSEGNLLSVMDARGHSTTFQYDDRNRLISRADPLGASETFTYDVFGNLVARTSRNGQTITYTYDPLNRLIEKDLPGKGSVKYTYDPLGHLLSATDSNGTLAFTYDALGRVVTGTGQDGRTLSYSYDPAGNRVARQDETGSLTVYGYDERNLLTSVTDPRSGTFTFVYDALGRRTRIARPNETVTSYTYDRASRLTGLLHTGRWGPFERLTYVYDPAGNRSADTRNRLSLQYRYDDLDQLTQVQGREGRARWKVEEAYSYDAVGNRLVGPEGQSYQYDAANRLTEDRTHAYAYGASGNLTEMRRLRDGRVTTYSYDAEDRLVRVVTPRTEVTFQYDPLGRRIEKRVIRWHDEDGDHEPDPDEEDPSRTVRYLYDQEDILATFNDAGREIARYTHGPGIDEPLAEVRRHHTRFYHADVLGSIITLTEKHGHSARDYRYSAFGIPEDHKGDSQPYRYTGREWDEETGMYYYRARYYTSRLGRFLSEDPVQGDQLLGSLYVYVKNNPLRYVDPTGKQWEPQPGIPGPMVLKSIESPLLRAAAIGGIISTGLLKVGVGAVTVSVGASSIPETGPAGLIVAGAGVLLITTGVAQVGGGIALIPVLFPLSTLPPGPGGQGVCPVETAPILLPTP